MSAGCPWCAMSAGGCQCSPCEACGALTFVDEFTYAHVCGLCTSEHAVPGSELHEAVGFGGYYPDEPRGRHTAILLTPPVTTAVVRPQVVHGAFTPTTRSLR